MTRAGIDQIATTKYGHLIDHDYKFTSMVTARHAAIHEIVRTAKQEGLVLRLVTYTEDYADNQSYGKQSLTPMLAHWKAEQTVLIRGDQMMFKKDKVGDNYGKIYRL